MSVNLRRFELPQRTRLTLAALKIGRENRGDDRKPTGVLRLLLKVDAKRLNSWFHPEMWDWLYTDEKPAGAQGQIPGTEHNERTQVRFPRMGKLSWDWEGTGYQLQIDYGAGGTKSDITISECRLSKFKITAEEGGTAIVEFDLMSGNIAERDRGRLWSMVYQELECTLMGPTVDTKPDLAGEKMPSDPPVPKVGNAGKKTTKAEQSKAELDKVGNPFPGKKAKTDKQVREELAEETDKAASQRAGAATDAVIAAAKSGQLGGAQPSAA